MKVNIQSAVGIVAILIAINCQAAVKIEEKVVGPSFTPGIVYTLSPNGMHVATTHGRDGKTLVTVDGVDGLLMDRIFDGAAGDTVVKISEDGYYTRVPQKWSGPVEFSPNGERHAYAGQIGQEAVVLLDGKEIYRGPLAKSGPAVENLQFSPDSQHLFFHIRTTDSYQSYQLMMDGKPVTPPFETAVMPFFSKDGSRWGLYAGKAKQWQVKFLIIDGKEAGYVGERPEFTPDGKHVVCVAGKMPKWSLLVDGKEMVSGSAITKFVISPIGDIGAIVTGADGRKKLFLNGKPVVDDAADVVFSPDGKRWAAICALNQKAWVILNDGTRHKEYWPIENVTFTPDSSKLVYVASIGDTNYVVTDGKESAGYKLIHYRPVYAETGNSFFYTAGFMMGRLAVHYNDHVEPECLAISNTTLSPDGKRWVYYSKRPDNTVRFIENGKENAPSAMMQGGRVLFSADSKHMVAPLFQAYWCDGQRIVSAAAPLGFTPDSQHLILKGRESTKDGVTLNTYYVNGDCVAKFSARGSTWSGIGIPKVWEQQPDGRIIFIGGDAIGLTGGHGPIKRITVTPDPARNYVAWLANPVTQDLVVKTEAPPPPPAAPAAKPAISAPPAPKPAATSAVAPTVPVLPAKPLKWADLENHPERWPDTTKVNVGLKFSSGALAAGSAVRIETVNATGAQLIAPQGFVFNVKPEHCDLLAAANAMWAKLTPEQRDLTPQKLAADPTLWPGKVKILEAGSFDSLKVPAGTEWPLMHVKPDELGISHPHSKEMLMFAFNDTDIFARARELALLPVAQRPGRMAALLEDVTIDNAGKPAVVPAANYYVFYFAASTCPRCKVFTPKFVEHFKKTLADRKDVAFVSWPTDVTTPPYLQYARENSIPWPTLPSEHASLFAQLGVFQIPGILVVDRFGNRLLATNQLSGPPLEAAEATLVKLNDALQPIP